MLSRVKGALNLVMCILLFSVWPFKLKLKVVSSGVACFSLLSFFFSLISILGALKSKRCIEPCYVYFTFQCMAIQIKAESCFIWCCLFFTTFIFFL